MAIARFCSSPGRRFSPRCVGPETSVPPSDAATDRERDLEQDGEQDQAEEEERFRIALMDLEVGPGVDGALAKAMTPAMTRELEAAGVFEAVPNEEIRQMLASPPARRSPVLVSDRPRGGRRRRRRHRGPGGHRQGQRRSPGPGVPGPRHRRRGHGHLHRFDEAVVTDRESYMQLVYLDQDGALDVVGGNDSDQLRILRGEGALVTVD